MRIDKITDNGQHNLLKKNVFNAWETLYNEQKEKNPFPTASARRGLQEAV